MKRLLCLVMLGLLLVSCASSSTQWKTEDVSKLQKGQSGEYVIERFGQPDRKQTAANGNQVWEYKKPTSSSNINTWIAIGSFGTVSAKEAGYVDMLRVQIQDNKVVDFSYEEKVMATAIPGLMTPNTKVTKTEEAAVKSSGESVTKTQEVNVKSSINSVSTDKPQENQSILIITAKTNVRSEPNSKSKSICTVHKGERVVKLDRSGSWFKVELISGSSGWVFKSYTKEEK